MFIYTRKILLCQDKLIHFKKGCLIRTASCSNKAASYKGYFKSPLFLKKSLILKDIVQLRIGVGID